MVKRKTDNIMAKRKTDNTMVKRKTDNSMAKREGKQYKIIMITLHALKTIETICNISVVPFL